MRNSRWGEMKSARQSRLQKKKVKMLINIYNVCVQGGVIQAAPQLHAPRVNYIYRATRDAAVASSFLQSFRNYGMTHKCDYKARRGLPIKSRHSRGLRVRVGVPVRKVTEAFRRRSQLRVVFALAAGNQLKPRPHRGTQDQEAVRNTQCGKVMPDLIGRSGDKIRYGAMSSGVLRALVSN